MISHWIERMNSKYSILFYSPYSRFKIFPLENYYIPLCSGHRCLKGHSVPLGILNCLWHGHFMIAFTPVFHLPHAAGEYWQKAERFYHHFLGGTIYENC